jgi:hypothetical protein
MDGIKVYQITYVWLRFKAVKWKKNNKNLELCGHSYGAGH